MWKRAEPQLKVAGGCETVHVHVQSVGATSPGGGSAVSDPVRAAWWSMGNPSPSVGSENVPDQGRGTAGGAVFVKGFPKKRRSIPPIISG